MLQKNTTNEPVKWIDRQVFADPSWWHWSLTIPLLAIHLAGVSGAIELAMALCFVASIYFYFRLLQLKPFPVQVRIAYLSLLVVGMLPWMFWVHWVQLIGTSAMVSVGYCPLIRLLTLFPLNRMEPLTWKSVGRTFFLDPCAGGIVSLSTNTKTTANTCCSLKKADLKLEGSTPAKKLHIAEFTSVPGA